MSDKSPNDEVNYENIQNQDISQTENIEKLMPLSEKIDEGTNFNVRGYRTTSEGKIKVLGIASKNNGYNEEDFKFYSTFPYHLNEHGVIEALLSSEELVEYHPKSTEKKEKTLKKIRSTSKKSNKPKNNLSSKTGSSNVDKKTEFDCSQEHNISQSNKKDKIFQFIPIMQRIKTSIIFPFHVSVKEEDNESSIRADNKKY
ncbi:hypothetical protein CDAR_554831 [Caerostris darwini]|uniref:Uncharacterized protein n=1 Tax=Caerostris darwini TaxID=1538125 RepID=A0AAV4N506_9ARAC|nr:hypothetical protein CDAR_554831 [Caerostris darwini]